MTTTRTHDVDSTLQQIAELTASGCDIVRVACPRQEDADALATIARKSPIPSSRTSFSAEVPLAAIDAGCAGVRARRKHQGLRRAGQGSREGCCSGGYPDPHRVNAGSLDQRLLRKYGKPTAEALVESALWEASLFEDHGFGNIRSR